MELVPCDRCHRHVRRADGQCAFCGGALSVRAVRRAPGVGKITRAAIFYLGASTAAACGGTDTDTTGHETTTEPEAIAMPYGAPPEPERVPEPDTEESEPAPTDETEAGDPETDDAAGDTAE